MSAVPRSGPADLLREIVPAAADRLRGMSDADAVRRPGEGRWAPKEILGHLVDSATNNHRRFVLAQLANPMRYGGYDQDAWVRVQRYVEADWLRLIDLWEALNLHLASIMEGIPAEPRGRLRSEHNLNEIAWELVPAEEPVTLEYFMWDYVGHLQHHLRQIDVRLAPPPGRQRSSP